MAVRKLVSRRDLKSVYGIPYSLVHIRRLEEAGQFPSRVTLGQCRVAYVASEVEEWIEDKLAKREAKPST